VQFYEPDALPDANQQKYTPHINTLTPEWEGGASFPLAFALRFQCPIKNKTFNAFIHKRFYLYTGKMITAQSKMKQSNNYITFAIMPSVGVLASEG